MLYLTVCNYRDALIPVSGTIVVTGPRADEATRLEEKRNEKVLYQDYVKNIITAEDWRKDANT